MKLFKTLLRERKGMVVLTVTLSIVAILINLGWSELLSRLINEATGEGILLTDVGKALLFMVASASLGYAVTRVSGSTSEFITHDLRMRYARHFVNLSFDQTEEINEGEGISVLQNEMMAVSGYVTNGLASFFGDGIRFVGTFSFLIYLNPVLAFSANLPVFLIVLYVVVTSKIIDSLTVKSQKAKKKMNGVSETLLSNFSTVCLYRAQNLMEGKFFKETDDFLKSASKAEGTRAGLMSLSGVMSAVPRILLLLIGGRMVIKNTMTIGVLYIFLNLSGNVSGVMMNMPSYAAGFRAFAGNMKSIESVIGEKE